MNELYLRVRAFSYLLLVMDTKRTFQVQNKSIEIGILRMLYSVLVFTIVLKSCPYR